MELVLKKDYGKMAALQGIKVISVPLEAAVSKLKTVDMELYDIAKIFFG